MLTKVDGQRFKRAKNMGWRGRHAALERGEGHLRDTTGNSRSCRIAIRRIENAYQNDNGQLARTNVQHLLLVLLLDGRDGGGGTFLVGCAGTSSLRRRCLGRARETRGRIELEQGVVVILLIKLYHLLFNRWCVPLPNLPFDKIGMFTAVTALEDSALSGFAPTTSPVWFPRTDQFQQSLGIDGGIFYVQNLVNVRPKLGINTIILWSPMVVVTSSAQTQKSRHGLCPCNARVVDGTTTADNVPVVVPNRLVEKSG
jgi:hypothetical protein